jgi:hypothetical protein
MIRLQVAAYLGKELTSATLMLESGAAVQVDGAAAAESAFVEIFSRQCALKGGQRHKVATDALKLITIGRSRPNADLVIAFADEQAASYPTKGRWMSEALAKLGYQGARCRARRGGPRRHQGRTGPTADGQSRVASATRRQAD